MNERIAGVLHSILEIAAAGTKWTHTHSIVMLAMITLAILTAAVQTCGAWHEETIQPAEFFR